MQSRDIGNIAITGFGPMVGQQRIIMSGLADTEARSDSSALDPIVLACEGLGTLTF